MLAINKPDKHSNGQTDPVASCTKYGAIYGSCTSSFVCSICTRSQAVYLQSAIGRSGLPPREHPRGDSSSFASIVPMPARKIHSGGDLTDLQLRKYCPFGYVVVGRVSYPFNSGSPVPPTSPAL
jgi:hypothetical protein